MGRSRQFPIECLEGYTRLLTYTGSRLLYERLNVRGSQVRVQDTRCFRRKSALIVTGSDDQEHPRAVDEELANWAGGTGRFGAVGLVARLWDRGQQAHADLIRLAGSSDSA